MADILMNFVIGVLRAVAMVYDIVSFVPYYVICQPGQVLKAKKRIKVGETYMVVLD